MVYKNGNSKFRYNYFRAESTKIGNYSTGRPMMIRDIEPYPINPHATGMINGSHDAGLTDVVLIATPWTIPPLKDFTFSAFAFDDYEEKTSAVPTDSITLKRAGRYRITGQYPITLTDISTALAWTALGVEVVSDPGGTPVVLTKLAEYGAGSGTTTVGKNVTLDRVFSTSAADTEIAVRATVTQSAGDATDKWKQDPLGYFDIEYIGKDIS